MTERTATLRRAIRRAKTRLATVNRLLDESARFTRDGCDREARAILALAGTEIGGAGEAVGQAHMALGVVMASGQSGPATSTIESEGEQTGE